MSDSRPRIAVTPPPVCKSPLLRESIERLFPGARFNPLDAYYGESELIEFLSGCDGALIGRDPITAGVIEALPDLKIVAKYGVGLDNIDQEALRRRGAVLGWTPGVNRNCVAELTLCFMIGLLHNVFRNGYALKEGVWNKDGGRELAAKTIGIVGCGNVGKEVVRLLQPFRCRILVHDILDLGEYCRSEGADQVGFEELLRRADIVTLHVPLTGLTFNMMNAAILAKMRPGAFLINTSRGEVVDASALKSALTGGALGGAALDVFFPEPPEDAELLSLPNLMVTPHIGGNAVEAVTAMAGAAIGHLADYFDKKR